MSLHILMDGRFTLTVGFMSPPGCPQVDLRTLALKG